MTSASDSGGPIGLFIAAHSSAQCRICHPHRPASPPCEKPPRARAIDNADADYIVAFSRPFPQHPNRCRDRRTRCLHVPPRGDRARPQKAGKPRLSLHTPLADAGSARSTTVAAQRRSKRRWGASESSARAEIDNCEGASVIQASQEDQ